MKISLAHNSAAKLVAVRIATNKSISTLMEEAMQLLLDKYSGEVLANVEYINIEPVKNSSNGSSGNGNHKG